MGDFNYIDLVVGILILLLGIKGIINGFVKEFFGFSGIVLGVYIASVYASSAGGWISDNLYTFKNPSAISLVGFLALLVGIWILAIILSEIVQRFVNLSALSGINRILGFCFGTMKVFIVFSIIVYALSHIELVRSLGAKYTQDSYLYPLLMKTGETIVRLEIVPKELPETSPAKELSLFNIKVSVAGV